MKLIKSILMAGLMLFIHTCIKAQEVPLSKVKEIGSNFFEQVLKERNIYQALPVVEDVTPIGDKNEIAYYIVSFKNGGYVFVSADYRSKPVLGFSPTGKFQEDSVSDGYKYFMNRYKTSINKYKNFKSKSDSQTVSKWKSIELKSQPSLKATDDNGIVERPPLLSCHWNQGGDWNNLCPDDGRGEQVPVGCVAVSMAQTIYYNKYPATGMGDHTDLNSSGVGGAQYANFGASTYNYTLMSNNAATAESEKLLYHCGVSVDMDYNYGGSGAGMGSMTKAFNNNFRYIHPEFVDEMNFTTDAWENLLKLHLNNLVVVPYAGWDTDPGTSADGGHAFVCDGYDDVYYETFFHFNFGWGGYGDNFFLTDAIANPDKVFNFQGAEAVLFVLKPESVSSYTMTANMVKQYMAKYLTSKSTLSAMVDENSGLFLQTSSSILFEPGFKVKRNGKLYARYGFNFEDGLDFRNDRLSDGTFPNDKPQSVINEPLLFPNPCSGVFSLKSETPGFVQIYSVSGTLIYCGQFLGQENIIDISGRPTGLYILKLSDSKGSVFKKIIKQ
jgi:hypothetical protein